MSDEKSQVAVAIKAAVHVSKVLVYTVPSHTRPWLIAFLRE